MYKNTLAKFTLTALAAFAISACGSSGGGDNGAAPANEQAQNQAQQPTTPVHPETPNTNTQPQQPSNNPTDGHISGGGFNLPKNGGNVQSLTLKGRDANADINTLEIEGKHINIFPVVPGVSLTVSFLQDDGGLARDGFVRKVGGGRSENIRYGLIQHEDFANSYLIAIGKNATEIMPQGQAEYRGRAVHGYARNDGRYINAYTSALSSFRADFDRKRITGTIIPDELSGPVSLYGDISGNTFEGELNGNKTKGGFYGQNASELTGRYYNEEKRFVGVYGAQKQ